MECKITCETWLVIFGTLLAILLRACTSLHPYSGEATPPMYGDYEAQRHWMEITTNLPVHEWYYETKDNHLNYWGLDYPPLTAYHMYFCGSIAGYINENYTKLHDSRGYESETHKIFMRYTVIIGDVLLYIPALVIYYKATEDLFSSQRTEIKKKKLKSQKSVPDAKPMSASLSTILALLYPGIILIDHGHFQYNCISLGLTIFAITFLLLEKNIFATIFFCLALNYKQMELYHALPFFFYLLSTCVPKPGHTALSGILTLLKISTTVIITFAVIWIPFLFNTKDTLQVIHRIFPIARGVFEDKVANVWCALNIFYKFRNCDNAKMIRICLFTTLSALFPSSADLFLRPNLRKFVLATINSSLAFFLFSFQVHEKSILLTAIPVLLYFPHAPVSCFWFLCISIFSMIPLLLKDNLIIAFIALTVFYIISFHVTLEHAYNSCLKIENRFSNSYMILLKTLLNIEYNQISWHEVLKQLIQKCKENTDALKNVIFYISMILSLLGCLILFGLALILKPPTRYPDLYTLLISVYSCIHFLGFFVYFNIKQLSIPQQFGDIKNMKLKSS